MKKVWKYELNTLGHDTIINVPAGTKFIKVAIPGWESAAVWAIVDTEVERMERIVVSWYWTGDAICPGSTYIDTVLSDGLTFHFFCKKEDSHA